MSFNSFNLITENAKLKQENSMLKTIHTGGPNNMNIDIINIMNENNKLRNIFTILNQ